MFQLKDELNRTLPSLVYEAEILSAPMAKNTVQKIEKYLCKTLDKKGKVDKVLVKWMFQDDSANELVSVKNLTGTQAKDFSKLPTCNARQVKEATENEAKRWKAEFSQ